MSIGREEDDIENDMKKVELPIVEEIKYLGTIKYKATDSEINNKINIANNVYFSLLKAVLSKREVSKRTKIKVYNAVFITSLIYRS